MVTCLSEYTDDTISAQGGVSSAKHMYDKMVDEGHDARLFLFSPSEDGTLDGSHQDTRNIDFWEVGCWGITASCSQVKIEIF